MNVYVADIIAIVWIVCATIFLVLASMASSKKDTIISTTFAVFLIICAVSMMIGVRA